MHLVVGILQSPSARQDFCAIFISKESCESWSRALVFPSADSMTSLNFNFVYVFNQ